MWVPLPLAGACGTSILTIFDRRTFFLEEIIDTCGLCESEFSQDSILGIFSAFLVLYMLSAHFGHPGEAARPVIKMKQNPLLSCGPSVNDSSSTDGSEEKGFVGQSTGQVSDTLFHLYGLVLLKSFLPQDSCHQESYQ